MERIPEVWSFSLPMKSQPRKLREVCGNETTATNFCLRLFGMVFKLITHSLRMIPPEFRHTTQSMSLEMSNYSRPLTQACCLYSTFYWASLSFSVSLIPEWAKIMRLKLTTWPFCSFTLMTACLFPIIMTWPSLSFYSIVSPGLVIAFSQE